MGKGMNMDEFKTALTSEKAIENDQLKIELQELKIKTTKQIIELTEDLGDYKNQCRSLSNRCFVFTQGLMCVSCNIDSCEHAVKEADMMAGVEYMIRNKMPRTEETREKVNSFINKLRFKNN